MSAANKPMKLTVAFGARSLSAERWADKALQAVRPYRVVAETWRASGTLLAGTVISTSPGTSEVHWLVGVWWISMLLGNGYSRVANGALEGAKRLADSRRYACQSITADCVTLIAALTVIIIVRTITGWQERARASQGPRTATP
jgi:hypothetical protein